MLCTCHDEQYLRAPRRSVAFATWPIIDTLRSFCDAWREALAAHRQYEHRRSRGVPHDAALKKSLGLGHAHANALIGGGWTVPVSMPVL